MNKRSPWAWVPTLYLAEGIPYFVVNVVSVTMFKRLGMGNAEIALYTSMLYLPWVVKFLWSPLVDVLKTKRWWIISMQAVMTLGLAALAMTVSDKWLSLLIIFYIVAFASATHDIAADGYYILSLDEKQQFFFSGIRTTFYRISSVLAQGVIVVIAGLLEMKLGDIPKAWSLTLFSCSTVFAAITLWHVWALPKTEVAATEKVSYASFWRGFAESWKTFFQKSGIALAICFILLFRLPEALSVKMLMPFLLDGPEVGGLGLSTAAAGMIYGTVGIIAMTVGGILGGMAASRWGLKKCLLPMSLALALPCVVYLVLAVFQPGQLWLICLLVSLDQFGYGFGFTANMLVMIKLSEGQFATSHYAICTAFMALSMMLPGFAAGWLQESAGYVGFFSIVMICCICTIAVTLLVRRRLS